MALSLMKLAVSASIIAEVFGSQAAGSNLAKAMDKSPEFQVEAGKALSSVEKCLVLSPFHDLPQVYQPAGRSDYSLIYYANVGQTAVIKLEQVGSTLKVTLWNDQGDKLEEGIKRCLN